MTRATPVPETVTLHVPFRIVKRGGRKQIVLPAGAFSKTQRPRINNTIVKTLARAFRWNKMIESNEFTTVRELAKAENISASHLSRALRLTLLAPDIIEAILDGRQPEGMRLDALLREIDRAWQRQKLKFEIK